MKNKLTKVLLIVSVLMLLVFVACSCGGNGDTDTDAICLHTETAVLEAKAPTCTEKGLTAGLKCAACETVLTAQTEIAALGHTEVTLDAVAATCTEKGLTEGKKCSVCDTITVAQEEIESLGGHTEVDLAAVAATCTETGLTAGKKCSVCETVTVEQEVIEALGHTEVDLAAVAATCTETGLTAGKKCSVCETVTVEQTTIAALGHKEVDVPAVDPTCTEKGLTAGKKCSVCNEFTVEQETVKALGHKEEVVAGTAATCTEDGLTDGKKCSVCGTDTVAQKKIDALGHKYEQHDYKAATCTEDGWDEYTECSVCGDTNKETLPALGHDMQEVAAREPTCTNIGWEAHTACTRNCGETNRVDIPMKDHDTEKVPAQAPTCVKTGWDEYDQCKDCSYNTKVTLPVVDHSYTIKGETVPSTCTEKGYTIYSCSGDETCEATANLDLVPALEHDIQNVEAKAETCINVGWAAYEYCSRCDYTTYVEIPAHGAHIYTISGEPVDATCTEKAYTPLYCSVDPDCTEFERQETGEALDHDYIDNEAKPVTCINEGWEAYQTCSRCDYSSKVVIPATGEHTFDVVIEVIDPTCTEGGYTIFGCSGDADCEATQNGAEEDALDHDYQIHAAKAATCINVGWDTYKTCGRENCNYTTYVENPATGIHVFDVEIDTIAADCVNDGYIIYGCSDDENCDAKENRANNDPAWGHEWVLDEDKLTEVGGELIPTCKTEGNWPYKCDNYGCKATKYNHEGQTPERIAHAGYIEGEYVSEPTCTEDGTYLCTDCGVTFNAAEYGGAKLGHDYVDHDGKAETCINIGWDAYRTCTRCDYNEYKAIPATGNHVFDKDATVTYPDCVSGGYTTTWCSNDPDCDAFEISDEVDALGHTFERETPSKKYVVKTEPTCTEKGLQIATCKDCGAENPDDTKVLNALGHSYERATDADGYGVEYVVTTAPTCITDGFATAKCTAEGCGVTDDEYGKVVDATGEHVYDVVIEVIAPKCKEIGYTIFGCSADENCDAKQNGAEVEALDHDYIDNEAKAETCINVGWEAYQTCSRCDYTTKVEIPATGNHVFDVELEVVAPKCLDQGYTIYGCSNDEDCDAKENRNFTDPIGHTYERADANMDEFNYTVTLAPTCITPGVEWVACDDCQYCTVNDEEQNPEYSRVIDATGVHSYDTVIEEFTASCTTYGYRYAQCSLDEKCAATQVTEWADKLDHNFGELNAETGTLTCLDCGINFRNVTADVLNENQGELCPNETCDENCKHFSIEINAVKNPEPDIVLPEGEEIEAPVVTVTNKDGTTSRKVIALIALAGDETTTYTLKYLDAEGNEIDSFSIEVGGESYEFDVVTSANGTVYIDISEIAESVEKITVTASAEATVAFYNIVK